MRRALAFNLLTKLNADSYFQSLNDYPIDPFQLRVPGTTTSLIFSKYGPRIHFQTALELIAQAQYRTIHAVVAARGDGPILQSTLLLSEKSLRLGISRTPKDYSFTWLMLADTLDGLRIFFDRLQGCFETEILILDDTVGPVGRGSLTSA